MPRLLVLGLFLLFSHVYIDCKAQEARYYDHKGKLVNFFLPGQNITYSIFKKAHKLTVKDSTGSQFISVQLRDAFLHGKFRVYSPGRKLIVKGYFKKGKVSGKWTFYNPQGKKLYTYNLDTFPPVEFRVSKRSSFTYKSKGCITLTSATPAEHKYGYGNGSSRLVEGSVNAHQKHINEEQHRKAHNLITLEVNEAGIFSSDIIDPYTERQYSIGWDPKLKNKNKISYYSKNIMHFCYVKDRFAVNIAAWNLDLYIINYYSWGVSNGNKWITEAITDSTYKIIVYNEKGELISDKSYIKVLREKCPHKGSSVKDYFMDIYGHTNYCHLEEVVFEHGPQRLFDYNNKWVEYNMKYGVYDQ